LQQHRNIEVGGATLECTLYGSGTPVVLLANAGCSTGYFDDLARVLAAGQAALRIASGDCSAELDRR
jgi:hypothetical protein